MSVPTLPRKPSGFTLPELLMVAFLSSLLVAGLAEGLHLFGEELESVRDESDKGPEEAMALMTDMARYGWSVEKTGAARFDVADALGDTTSFQVTDGVLSITRPSGVTGPLLTGVEDLVIETDAMRRLREAHPVDEYRTWWEVPDGGSAMLLELESGLPVALGFTLASDVPDGFDVVEGVDETTMFASLETLVLSLAYLGTIPTDPNPPISGGSPGGKKVKICHVPPGNPDNAHTINVSINAMDAHLDHGDLLGECGPEPDNQAFPNVSIQLFEARAPDDARPVGPPLASMVLVGQALPPASAQWVPTYPGNLTHFVHDHSAAECAATTATGKVVMCHVPPGNPGNSHTITISPSAVPAHLAHGDYFLSCGAHGTPANVYTLKLNATPVPYSFDLSPLGALIEPGRAYTLLFTMTGPGILYMDAASLASASNSGVAQASAGFGDVVPVAASVPFALKGMQRITQTDEHEPVSRVSLALEMEGGSSVLGSASIASQVTVPGEWLGVVPGEVADIDP
jgi:prepilin-type N-terminal cleavage/methylation domain-containing protein